ncbi:MAG: polysaccharide biosynthesis/export family protein [Calditrichia bacterium]
MTSGRIQWLTKAYLLVYVSMAFMLCGCGSTLPAIHQADTGIYSDEYLLGAGDVVALIVYQRQELSGDYIISPDGTIGLPIAGNVKIADLNRLEAEKALKEALSEIYSPVSLLLKIREYQKNEMFVVLGEVRNPGTYPIRNQVSLMTAIGLAGGFTDDAAVSRIRLSRNRDLPGGVYSVNLKEITSNANFEQNYIIRRQDVIYVPRSRSSILLGSLNKITPLMNAVILATLLVNSLAKSDN